MPVASILSVVALAVTALGHQDLPVRGFGPNSQDATNHFNRNRWALVIGISDYQDDLLDLDFAHRDAKAISDFLLSPAGGSFPTEQILLLRDQEATSDAITRGLRTFLKRPSADDLVLIFLACHGAPDPDRPQEFYLLPWDSDSSDISSTGIPMREVHHALQETLLAERVVLLADTCHSAQLGGTLRRSNPSATFDNYLQRVAASRPGMAILSSAEGSESSREDAKWGGGHGVFTHFTLEGLRGAADTTPRDGLVTVGELIDYVRAEVIRATENQQHPAVGSESFDRGLPLAITSSYDVRCSLRLAESLLILGFASGSTHLRERALAEYESALPIARALTGESHRDALAGTALAAMSVGMPTTSLEALDQLDAEYPGHEIASYAWRALSLADRGLEAQAQDAMSYFVEHQYPPRATIPSEHLVRVLDPARCAPRALLVGIGKQEEGIPPLEGPHNDVRVLRDAFLRHELVTAENLAIEIDATKEQLLRAIEQLADSCSPTTPVIVYFSGHAMQHSESQFLMCADASPLAFTDGDTSSEAAHEGILSAEEVDAAIRSLNAGTVTLILDTCHNPHFQEIALQSSDHYRVLWGCANGQAGTELETPSGMVGTFTESLKSSLDRNSAQAPIAQLLGTIHLAFPLPTESQTPQIIGDSVTPLIPHALSAARAQLVPFSSHDTACYLPSRPEGDSDLTTAITLRSAALHVEERNDERGVEILASHQDSHQIDRCLSLIQSLIEQKPVVLLIDTTQPNESKSANLNLPVQRLERAFIQAGIEVGRIETISGKAATGKRIREAIQKLAIASESSPGVLYLAAGTFAPPDSPPRIIPSDFDIEHPLLSSVDTEGIVESTVSAPGFATLFHEIKASRPSTRGSRGLGKAPPSLKVGWATVQITSESIIDALKADANPRLAEFQERAERALAISSALTADQRLFSTTSQRRVVVKRLNDTCIEHLAIRARASIGAALSARRISNSQAALWDGVISSIQGEHQVALDSFRRTRPDPDDAHVLILFRGLSNLAVGEDLSAAVSDFEKLTTLTPGDSLAHRLYGYALRRFALGDLQSKWSESLRRSAYLDKSENLLLELAGLGRLTGVLE